MFRLISIALSVLAVHVACADAADDYEIRFFRPERVGDRYRLVASGSQEFRMDTFANDVKEESHEEKFDASLDAIAEVLKIDEDGQATEISYKVDRCVRVENGQAIELAPKDAILLAKREGDETTFSLREGELNPAAQESLSLIIPLGKGAAEEDDKIFGTTERRRVGDVWPVNAAAVVRALKEEDGVEVPASAVSGEVKVVGAKTVSNQQCLEIAARFSIEGALPGMGQLPPGMTLKRAVVNAEAVGSFPIDVTKNVVEDVYKMKLEAEVVSSKAPLRFVRSSTRMKKTARTPLD
jgi:hypothetical protein